MKILYVLVLVIFACVRMIALSKKQCLLLDKIANKMVKKNRNFNGGTIHFYFTLVILE